MRIPSEAFSLIACASKEPGRFAISGLQVGCKASGLGWAQATNGHLCARVEWLEPEPECREDLSVLLDREQVCAVPGSWTRRAGRPMWVELTREKGVASLHFPTGGVVAYPEAQGKFPPLLQVIAKYKPLDGRVGLGQWSSEKFTQLSRALRPFHCEKRGPDLRWTSSDAHAAAWLGIRKSELRSPFTFAVGLLLGLSIPADVPEAHVWGMPGGVPALEGATA